jgi:hypothetical protein
MDVLSKWKKGWEEANGLIGCLYIQLIKMSQKLELYVLYQLQQK